MNYKKSNGLNCILISRHCTLPGLFPCPKQKSYCHGAANFSQKHIKKEFRFITPELLYLISESFCTVLSRLKIMTSGETKISSALPRPEKFLQKHMPVFPENP